MGHAFKRRVVIVLTVECDIQLEARHLSENQKWVKSLPFDESFYFRL